MTAVPDGVRRPTRLVPGRAIVHSLGAGPGDPGLMTLRGADLLQGASAGVSDERVPDDIVDASVPAAVERITSADLGQTTTTRGRRLVALARDHGTVVRIVPHDGVLFSTTTDEAAAVMRAEVDVEMVPGVGISSSISAFTGTPITTNRTRSVRFVEAGPQTHTDVSRHRNTGHVVSGRPARIAEAVAALLEDGWDADVPVLMTTGLSTLEQVTIEATLGTAVERLETERAAGECLDCDVHMLLGHAIEKRADLSWFESKPLFGWKVLVPRTKEQGASTRELLAGYGAEGTVVPTIVVQPPRTPTKIQKAIRALVDGDYQWVGFTSVNAVRAVRMRVTELGLDVRALAGLKVAAVGGRTADSLREWGIEPDLVPSGEHSARGLLAEWPDFDPEIDALGRVLLPRADIATDVLVDGLLDRGWDVDDVTAYRTVRAAPPPAPVRESIKSGEFDAVLFTSSSTVRNLVGIAGKPHRNTVVACIGPATAQTARDHGLTVDVLAAEANLGSLVEGLADHARKLRAEDSAAGRTPTRPSRSRVRRRK
ncbi:uroporphyrinogen-III synthase [Brevibacterium litoralis]|uniref:uroporphyrinogen-III synthase n=1 Tax=Brevibacterium litoralis TaxID=3138935 RepID=UPI0032EF6D0E